MEVPIELDSNEGIKTLGLLWYQLSDQFLISKRTCAQKLREPKNSPVRKRTISSIVTKWQTHSQNTTIFIAMSAWIT